MREAFATRHASLPPHTGPMEPDLPACPPFRPCPPCPPARLRSNCFLYYGLTPTANQTAALPSPPWERAELRAGDGDGDGWSSLDPPGAAGVAVVGGSSGGSELAHVCFARVTGVATPAGEPPPPQQQQQQQQDPVCTYQPMISQLGDLQVRFCPWVAVGPPRY
eukprot:SAG11_NODE_113_length_16061_cov_16.161143_8_plen_164_part_00